MGSKFEMKDMGEANVILGVKIIRNRGNVLRNFLWSLSIMTLN